MDEPLSTIEAPAQIGSDGSVTLEGVTFPPVEQEETPLVETQTEPSAEVTPEPTPEPPPVNQDFTFSTLENGEREVRLSSGEVFKGKTDADVIQALANSKLEATRYIQQLKSAPAPVTNPTPVQSEQPQIDAATMALVDMIAPAFGVKSGTELIAGWQNMQKQQGEFGNIAQETRLQQTAADFIRTTPDFIITPANTERMEKTLDAMGLQPTVENLKFVHYSLKGQGLYEQVIAPTTAPRTANGQFAPQNTMPLPPNGSAPAAPTGKGTPTESDFSKMTTAELGEWLETQAYA